MTCICIVCLHFPNLKSFVGLLSMITTVTLSSEASHSCLDACVYLSLPGDLLLFTCQECRKQDLAELAEVIQWCHQFRSTLPTLQACMTYMPPEKIQLFAQLFLCGLRLSLWATSKRVARSRCAICWIWEREKKIICWKIHDCVGKKPKLFDLNQLWITDLKSFLLSVGGHGTPGSFPSQQLPSGKQVRQIFHEKYFRSREIQVKTEDDFALVTLLYHSHIFSPLPTYSYKYASDSSTY